jgi:hypothetical protein
MNGYIVFIITQLETQSHASEIKSLMDLYTFVFNYLPYNQFGMYYYAIRVTPR